MGIRRVILASLAATTGALVASGAVPAVASVPISASTPTTPVPSTRVSHKPGAPGPGSPTPGPHKPRRHKPGPHKPRPHKPRPHKHKHKHKHKHNAGSHKKPGNIAAAPNPGAPNPGGPSPSTTRKHGSHKHGSHGTAKPKAAKSNAATPKPGKTKAGKTTVAPKPVLTGAAATLATAIAGLRGVGYNVSGTSGSSGPGSTVTTTAQGSIDPADHAAALNVVGTRDGVPVHVAMTQVGDRLWALVDIGAMQRTIGVDPAAWMLLDQNMLDGPDSELFDLSGTTDPLDIEGLLAGVSDVQATDPTHLTGIVDLTAATGLSAPSPEELAGAGPVAATTPFTATIDDWGRLTELRIDADSYSRDMSRYIVFSNFGSPNPVAPPPADHVIGAPETVYPYFNTP